MRFLFAFLFAFFCLQAPAFAQEEPAVETDVPTEEVTAVADTDAAPAVAEPEPILTEPEPEEPEAAEDEGPPEVPGELASPAEVVDTFELVISAAKEGNWGLMIAAILMLIVWVVRNFLWKAFPKEWLPYVTLGIATVGGFGASVIAGMGAWEALLVAVGGLFAGLAAVGAWETLGKRLLPKPDPKDE